MNPNKMALYFGLPGPKIPSFPEVDHGDTTLQKALNNITALGRRVFECIS